MQRPSVVRGRYFYGQEVICGENDQSLNEIKTQYSRMDRQILDGNLNDDSQPTDAFELRHRQFIRQAGRGGIHASSIIHCNVNDNGYYVARSNPESGHWSYHGYGHPLPVFGARHRDSNLLMQGNSDAGYGSYFNYDNGDYVARSSNY
ncbi:hypothetical protein Bhyg_07835 [Pseudolycoriella hygida]|uniref:Uncharacterized protein n=1 Tax=Pseudolycoriella hygida TaxID=35572 RepID=A0A9Q0N589_9DIPT|nr:hypothetical protein Bhyg_07835 [Pseudolycoriella hygida]